MLDDLDFIFPEFSADKSEPLAGNACVSNDEKLWEQIRQEYEAMYADSLKALSKVEKIFRDVALGNANRKIGIHPFRDISLGFDPSETFNDIFNAKVTDSQRTIMGTFLENVGKKAALHSTIWGMVKKALAKNTGTDLILVRRNQKFLVSVKSSWNALNSDGKAGQRKNSIQYYSSIVNADRLAGRHFKTYLVSVFLISPISQWKEGLVQVGDKDIALRIGATELPHLEYEGLIGWGFLTADPHFHLQLGRKLHQWVKEKDWRGEVRRTKEECYRCYKKICMKEEVFDPDHYITNIMGPLTENALLANPYIPYEPFTPQVEFHKGDGVLVDVGEGEDIVGTVASIDDEGYLYVSYSGGRNTRCVHPSNCRPNFSEGGLTSSPDRVV